MSIYESVFTSRLSATCLIPILLLAACERTPNAEDTIETQDLPESTFSEALRFEGNIVEELPSGQVIRETAFLRGKRFDWDGKAEGRVAEEELPLSVELAPDIDDISVEELAENLRGVALFAGHRFVEAEPATELAVEMKMLRDMEGRGATVEEIEKVLPTRPSSPGTTETNSDFDQVEDMKPDDADVGPTDRNTEENEGDATVSQETPQEGGSGGVASNIAFLVHGVDDRRVMNNLWYPHRTHIVFDNVGSTSTINGSQGSGTLIGPSTAMSVAHVFWNEGGNTWESDHRWAPGYDSQDSDPSPYGEWFGCYWVTIPIAYTIYENTTYDYAILDFDVGCNSTRNGVNSDIPGASVGWLGFYTASESDIESRTGFLRGYPANGTCGNPGVSCNVRVWGDTSSSSENDALSLTIRHQADSSGGQSGSGFYHYGDPSCSGCGFGPYVVGMHRAGLNAYNEARRYTSGVHSFMRSYSSDY